MNEITFEILKIVVSVASALVAAYLIPYIKAKTSATKYQDVVGMVQLAVRAAEQTIRGSGQGAVKKEQVVDFCIKWLSDHGITMSAEMLDRLIEAAVYAMKQEDM